MSCGPSWQDEATRREALELLGGLVILAMIPENPVVGGTVLRRAAIQSPNFVTGSAGWSVNQDGSAEFNNIVIRNGQVISGVALYYSPNPGFGNLVASIAGAAGTDVFGNAYVSGVTSYTGGNQAASLTNGELALYTAAGAGGPWNIKGTLLFTGGALNLAAGVGTGAPVNIFADSGQSVVLHNFTDHLIGAIVRNGLQVTGGLTSDVTAISDAQGATPILDVTNTQSGSASVLRSTAQAVGNILISGRVAGDSNARLVLDTIAATGQPRIRVGPGSAAADCQVFRVSAGVFGVDDLTFNDGSGVGEAWNLVTTFANSWANAGTGPSMQYKRIPSPDNTVELVGRLTAPAGIAANQSIFTLPAGYRPNTLQGLMAVNVSTGAIVRLTVTGNTGVVQYQSGAVAGNNIDVPAGTLVSLLA